MLIGMALLNNKDRMQDGSKDFNADRTELENVKAYNSEIEKHVGKKIKLFRQLKGLSQSDVAVHLGITFQQFQKYESGKNRIPISRLMKLASIFGVNMTVFFDNSLNVVFEDIMVKKANKLQESVTQIEVSSNPRSSSISVSEFTADEDMQQLIKYFKLIKDSSVKKHILMLVKSLSEESKS